MTRRMLVVGICLAGGLAVATTAWTQTEERKPVRKRAAPKRVLVKKSEPVDPGPAFPSAIKSNVVDCVDPEVGPPPMRLKARSGTTMRRAAVKPLRLSRAGLRTEQLSFVPPASASKTSGATDQLAPSPGTSCQAQASFDFYSQGMVLPNMPAVNFPTQPCDDSARCRTTANAWMRAHYYVWIARQVIHHVAQLDHSQKRSWAWRRPGVNAKGEKLPEKSSPAYWFGAYSDKRLEAIKDGIDQLWDVMKTNKTGGINVELRCPDPDQSANVCYTAKPAAHHIVKGKVDLCPGFYGDRPAWDKGRIIAHELLHHLWVDWGDVWVAVQDKHYHGHGSGCGISPDSSAQYGEDKIVHLATYRNSKGSDCGHLARNVRNNDTYAYFILWMGELVYNGSMTQWPAPADPTPQPPQCVGDEGCLCADENSWPSNRPFEPDGDYSPDQWCDDNDGEMTCMATKFGATTKGICTKCDDVRGPGCECDDGRPCEVGSCFGDDTFNGGTGHCFEDPPPTWACLADCERLFNDEAAWCYADYPTGQARCMSNLCTEPEAYNCNKDSGGVCRYGDCVVECTDKADCEEKGYPSYYVCRQSRCEYDF